jgi:hypothetical protein
MSFEQISRRFAAARDASRFRRDFCGKMSQAVSKNSGCDGKMIFVSSGGERQAIAKKQQRRRES